MDVARRKNSRYPQGIPAFSDNGRRFGLMITDADKARIKQLARWYCLNADHLVRLELGLDQWHPDHVTTLDGKPTLEYEKHLYAVKRRLAKLTRIEENAGASTGPLVKSMFVGQNDVVWHSTRYGVTTVGLPWTIASSINPRSAHHAKMAASVGMQIERLGVTVYSEREIATGTAWNGDPIQASIGSQYIGPQGGKSITKKPDLTIIGDNSRDWIAIEIERERDRPYKVYQEKLSAYRNDPNVRAVWYMCEHQNTANRIIKAAQNIGVPDDFPLRLGLLQSTNGLPELPGLESKETILSDIRAVTDVMERNRPRHGYTTGEGVVA